MVRRARHPSIMFYTAGFITPPVPNWQTPLYVEYCDRGSLQDFIHKYVSHRRTKNPDIIVPEVCTTDSLLFKLLLYESIGNMLFHQKWSVSSWTILGIWLTFWQRFIWHATIGLCDGIAYLRGGQSYVGPDCHDYTPVPGWQPILHRDIKPDNILLKSRVSIGSEKYFYCVISDFGLACEDLPPMDPRLDRLQRTGFPCGVSPSRPLIL